MYREKIDRFIDAHQNESGKEIGAYVSLDELLKEADVISLNCPLFPETEGIINEKNKKIQYSRGNTVPSWNHHFVADILCGRC